MRDLILPWPSRDLHPNARVHWSRRARAAKSARRAADALAREAGWCRMELPAGRLHLWIDAYPPDRRRRDTDGVLSSLKSALDGIADALGVDDRRFVPHPFLHDEPRNGGEIRIRITAGEAPCSPNP
jgi:Endodeoxyribonuclease RusA.